MNGQFSYAVALLCAAASLVNTLRVDAADLTISAGESETITTNATYGTITVNGTLVIAGSSASVTATTVLVAEGTGETGILTVTDNASLTVTGERSGAYYPFSVGHAPSAGGSGTAVGIVNVLNGATVTTHDLLVANMESCNGNSSVGTLNITNASVTVNANMWTTRGYSYAGYDGSWYPATISLGPNATLQANYYTRNADSKTRFIFGGGRFRYRNCTSGDGGTVVMEGLDHAIDLELTATSGGASLFTITSGNTKKCGKVLLSGNGGLTVRSTVWLTASVTNDQGTAHTGLSATYTGPLTLLTPGVKQMAEGQLCSGANALVLSYPAGAYFDLNGFDAAFPAITEGAGFIRNTAEAAGTLTVGGGGADGMVRALAGPIAIRKLGSGTWAVVADDLAGVTVEAGTLNLLAPSEVGYRCWQFFPTAVWGPSSPYLQLSELDYLDANGIEQDDLLRTEGAMSADARTRLYDGEVVSPNVCFTAIPASGDMTATAVFGSPRPVVSYRWATAHDYGTETKYGGRTDVAEVRPPSYNVAMCRDPMDWTIRASNDGATWKTMDTVAGFKATNDRYTYNPTNFVCTYSDRLVTGPVAVAAGATLNVPAGTLAPTDWNVKGTANLADGCTYVVGGAADASILDLAEAFGLEKTGANRQQVVGGTLTGRVHVAAGTLVLGGHAGVSQKYWRWRIKKMKAWWTDPAKNVDGAQVPVAFQMSELGLFDANGNRVNLRSGGTTVVSQDNSGFSGLLDGADAGCFVPIAGTWGSGTATIPMPDPADESTWSGFTFKLPDNAQPVFAYQFETGGDHTDRDPVSWDFAVSDDGTAWTVVEERADEVIGIARYSWTAYNGGEPFLFKVPTDPADLAAGADVQVDAGATLAFPGAGTALGALTVDCAVGGGTITHFNPAAHGTLDLVNVAAGTDVTSLNLLTFGTVVNAANLSGWTVTVNGAPRGFRLVVENGTLRLAEKGTLLVIR